MTQIFGIPITNYSKLLKEGRSVNLKELEQKYEELGAEIERLKSEQAKDEEWPKVGEIVWSLFFGGRIGKIRYSGDTTDKFNLNAGFIQRTKEEVEAYSDWLTNPRTQARRKVEMCDGFDPSGEFVIIVRSTGSLDTYSDCVPEGGLRFKTEEHALTCIDKLGEDVIKTALGVEAV